MSDNQQNPNTAKTPAPAKTKTKTTKTKKPCACATSWETHCRQAETKSHAQAEQLRQLDKDLDTIVNTLIDTQKEVMGLTMKNSLLEVDIEEANAKLVKAPKRIELFALAWVWFVLGSVLATEALPPAVIRLAQANPPAQYQAQVSASPDVEPVCSPGIDVCE